MQVIRVYIPGIQNRCSWPSLRSVPATVHFTHRHAHTTHTPCLVYVIFLKTRFVYRIVYLPRCARGESRSLWDLRGVIVAEETCRFLTTPRESRLYEYKTETISFPLKYASYVAHFNIIVIGKCIM